MRYVAFEGPNTPVRLNGSNSSSGMVELNYEDEWGTICPEDFDNKDANVVCRMLGYKIGSGISNLAHILTLSLISVLKKKMRKTPHTFY